MPLSICFCTTCAIASPTAVLSSALRAPRFCCSASKSSITLAVRGRLPVCVVRIRSVLRFMWLRSPPAVSAWARPLGQNQRASWWLSGRRASQQTGFQLEATPSSLRSRVSLTRFGPREGVGRPVLHHERTCERWGPHIGAQRRRGDGVAWHRVGRRWCPCDLCVLAFGYGRGDQHSRLRALLPRSVFLESITDTSPIRSKMPWISDCKVSMQL